MKVFNNLMEATAYHDKCYVCDGRLVHNLEIDVSLDRPLTYKWNLSESVDSDTNDWVVVDAYSNKITYIEQSRKYGDEIVYGIGNEIVDRIRRYSMGRKFSGILYESIHMECNKCHQFSYTIQVVINATAKKLEGIFLNSEFISYEDEGGHLHEVKNSYSLEKTEYNYTEKCDGKSISVPLIPLDLNNPAETVARIKKLVIFS